MKDILRAADEMPATLAIAVVCGTLTALMDPFHPAAEDLLRYGASRAVDVADGQPWRLVTYMFVHNAGAVHLLFNLAGLFWLGPLLERSYGSLRFLLLFLVTGIVGGIAGCWWHPPLANLGGASGSVFGLMGAVLAANARSGRGPLSMLDQGGPRGFLAVVGITFLQTLIFPGISHAAHLGGFLAGILLTYWFLDLARVEPTMALRRQQATVIALFLGACCYALQPVTRPDHLLLEWNASAPGPRRGELQKAYSLAMGIGFPLSDEQMTAIGAHLQKARTQPGSR